MDARQAEHGREDRRRFRRSCSSSSCSSTGSESRSPAIAGFSVRRPGRRRQRLGCARLHPDLPLVAIVVAIGDRRAAAQRRRLRAAGLAERRCRRARRVAVLLILYRIISPPDFGSFGGVDGRRRRSKFGIFLGLIAAAGIAYGGYSGDAGGRARPSATPPTSSRGGGLRRQPASSRRAQRRHPRTASSTAASAPARRSSGGVAGEAIALSLLRAGMPGAGASAEESRRAPLAPLPLATRLAKAMIGHHRVDPDRGGEEAGVGDVEAVGRRGRRRRGRRRPSPGRRRSARSPSGERPPGAARTGLKRRRLERRPGPPGGRTPTRPMLG